MATLSVPIRIKRGDGLPTQLRQGELAFDQTAVKLYIGSGTEVGGYAPSVVELTTPPTVLEDLANISVGSGAADGDVLVYDGDSGDWVAEALAAASVAWGDITSKPAAFPPDTHASSHHTGGGDAIAPADIGAAAASHTHDASEITSLANVAKSGSYTDLENIPSTFTPASHTHGSITNDGKIGSTAGLVVQTGASGAVTTLAAGTSGQVLKQGASGLEWGTAGGVGTVTSVTAGTGLTGGEITSSGTIAVTYGTTAGTACEGNDSRLDDTRTPTDNTVATAKIQDGAVTYAKIQNVSATDKILGRATAGAGDVEEITCTAAGRALLDDADAAAQRTTLGLGGAAEKAVDFYATASHTHDASDINSGTLDIARIPTGSTSSTVCIGDDARLTNNRDPNSHTHGNITDAGAIGTTANLPVVTTTSGVLTTLALGTSGQYLRVDTNDPPGVEWVTPSIVAHNHTVTLEMSGLIESPEAKTYVISPAIPAAITITQFKAQTSAGTVDLAVHDDGTLVTGCSLADAGTTLASLGSAISESVAAGSKLALVVSDLQSSPADLAFSIHYTVTSANNT